MPVSRFEDLIAWQKARVLTAEIYRLTRETEMRRDFGLRDQITRASASIMANIAEGFDRNSATEFAHFLNIARGSASEVRSFLYVAFDAGYIDESVLDRLTEQSHEVLRVVSGLRTSVLRH